MVNRTNRTRSNYNMSNNSIDRIGESSCNGCNNVANNARNSCNKDNHLMKKLQTVDFSLVDTVLYLDAYPHCQKALAHYHKLLEERAMIISKLKEAGIPLNNMSNTKDSWNWIDSPWPWEYEANV